MFYGVAATINIYGEASKGNIFLKGGSRYFSLNSDQWLTRERRPTDMKTDRRSRTSGNFTLAAKFSDGGNQVLYTDNTLSTHPAPI